MEAARCCWSYIAESKDRPRRAQYLLENIIIAGCIFGIVSWPLFLRSPMGDLGAVWGPFGLVCSLEDIVVVSWDVLFPCISYGEGAVVSDDVSLSCPFRDNWELLACATVLNTPPPAVSELGLYTVKNDVEKGRCLTGQAIAHISFWGDGCSIRKCQHVQALIEVDKLISPCRRHESRAK